MQETRDYVWGQKIHNAANDNSFLFPPTQRRRFLLKGETFFVERDRMTGISTTLLRQIDAGLTRLKADVRKEGERDRGKAKEKAWHIAG